MDEKTTCSECLCNIEGSLKSDNTTCTNIDSCPCNTDGVCTCSTRYMGEKCNLCNLGYFDGDDNDNDAIANCTECLCNIEGSLKSDKSTCTSTDPCPCNSDGVCTCSTGFGEDKCNVQVHSNHPSKSYFLGMGLVKSQPEGILVIPT